MSGLLDRLKEMVDSEAPPPCEQFSCSQRSRCADDELACSAFAYYVRSGRVVHPYMTIPKRVTSLQRPVMGEQAEPTRGIFISLRNM